MSLFDRVFNRNKTDISHKNVQLTQTFTNQTQDIEGDFISILGSPKNANQTLLELFTNVGEVNGIISHLARVASNVELKHVQVQGNGKEKEVKNSEIIKLLANPNPLKGGQILLQEVYASFFVFGNVYLNAFKPIGFKQPTKLYQLPSTDTFAIPERSQDEYGTPMFGSDFRYNPIAKYNFFIDSTPKSIVLEEIIHIKDTNLSVSGANAYYGKSMLFSAIANCETLKYLYETINTILSKRGALGFIKKNNRAGEMATTLSEKEISQIINTLNKRYGVTGGRQPIGVVNTDLSYQRIDAPISEFIPIELKADMVKTLCRVLGNLPVQLFSSEAASTYNNMREAEKQMYQGAIMPTIELFCSEITKYFKLDELGQKIVPNYDDIDCLQEDKKVTADTEKVVNENYKFLLDAGLITKEYWAVQIGLPTNMITNETNT